MKCGDEVKNQNRRPPLDGSRSLDALKVLLEKRNAILPEFKNVRPLLKELREYIGQHYAALIQKNYDHFVMTFMDDLYKNHSSLSEDMGKVFATQGIRDTNNFFECFYNTLHCIGEIRSILAGQEENVLALMKAIDAHPNTKYEFCLSDIPRAMACLNQPRYVDFIPKGCNLPNKDAVQFANKQISHLKKAVNHLANYEDKTYRAVRESCAVLNSTDSLLEKFFIQLEYLIVPQFNLEIMLLFMFLDDIPSSVYPAKFVITKYESFFGNILAELKNNGQELNINILLGLTPSLEYEGISDLYVSMGTPPAHDLPGNNMFFRLKKILALFRFYNAAGNRVVSKEVSLACALLDRVLTETKLSDVSYNYILDYLPEYIIDTLGINKNNLATLLGITPKNVSETIANGTILEKHRWFWQAVSGYSYTYLSGETTIPSYGSMEAVENIEYRNHPVNIKAYAEIIISRLLDLATYEKSLSSSSKVSKMRRKKYVLSAPYLKFISDKAYKLVANIMRTRSSIESLLEKKRTFQIQQIDYNRLMKVDKSIKQINKGYEKSRNQLEKKIKNSLNSNNDEIEQLNRKIETELSQIAKLLKGESGELSDAEIKEIKIILKEQDKYENKDL